jgi:hypothetical protein
MTDIFVLERAEANQAIDRIPDNLPVNSPEREVLERALRDAELAIVPLGSLIDSLSAPIDSLRALRESVAAVVNAATEEDLDRLRAAVTTEPDDDLDVTFWGSAPDSITVTKAAFSDLRDQFAARRQLSEESISRDGAARLLDVAPQSITAKLAAHKLVGTKVDRQWRLPLWQFDPDAPSGVLPELDVLQSVFPGGVVSLSAWMQREQPEFGGRAPREEMALRGSEPVIALARALTVTAW